MSDNYFSKGDNNGDRMPVPNSPNSREPRYWESIDGGFLANKQPGPPKVVFVGQSGISIHKLDIDLIVQFSSIGEARWIANRLLEACAIYETIVSKENDGHDDERSIKEA